MSKKINIVENVMTRISQEHIGMKPKWYFLLGSLAFIIGFSALTILSIFLVSLISFSIRTHGPMGEIRYQQILSNFPWWAPFIAVVGLGIGILLMKKLDLSYKKNFILIVIGFILAVVFSGWLVDYFNLDTIFMKQGLVRGIYQQYDGGFRGYGRGNNQRNLTLPRFNRGVGQ